MERETAIAHYERLLATVHGIERKGDKMPYTSHNGNMFTMAGEDGVALRLAKADRDRFIERFGTRLAMSHGATLKEYVAVPEEVLGDTDVLAPWMAKSWEYVQGLKPKRTTRRK